MLRMMCMVMWAWQVRGLFGEMGWEAQDQFSLLRWEELKEELNMNQELQRARELVESLEKQLAAQLDGEERRLESELNRIRNEMADGLGELLEYFGACSLHRNFYRYECRRFPAPLQVWAEKQLNAKNQPLLTELANLRQQRADLVSKKKQARKELEESTEAMTKTEHLINELQRKARENLENLVEQDGRACAYGRYKFMYSWVWILGIGILSFYLGQRFRTPRPSPAKKVDPGAEPKDLDETSDSSESQCTIGSWTHVASGESRCFLPGTYFKVLTDDGVILAPARMPFQGAQVVAANDKILEVVHPPEQHQVDAVIELQAGGASLTVSSDHRILIPGNKTIQAKELEEGNEVILDGTPAILTSVQWKLEPTLVLKHGFNPDLPVAAFMRSPSILSKGFRKKPFRRGKRRTQEAATIPDTEGYLTD